MVEFTVSADGEVSAVVRLESWRGSRDASGPYGSSQGEVSDGAVEVILWREIYDQAEGKATDRELKAVEFLRENERAISESLVAAVAELYPTIRAWLQECGVPEDELAEIAPLVEGVQAIRGLIGLGEVHVLPSHADEPPYLGLVLGCSWDEEHGLGAAFRGVELIKLGDAAVGFDGSIPASDRILRNVEEHLARSGVGQRHTMSRRQALWRYAPWSEGPWPELAVCDESGRLILAVDVTDFHWEGEERWPQHFIQYRKEHQSFVRLTIGDVKPVLRVWKREAPDGADWKPIREAFGTEATIRLDELGIDLPAAAVYS